MQHHRKRRGSLMAAREHIPISRLQAARADEQLQRRAKHLPPEFFERVERDLLRRGVSLDTTEWTYFRAPESSWQGPDGREGWVLWRPITGEQLAFLTVGVG
jgi:hypothetical protein